MNKRWVVSIAATSMLMLNGIPTAALAQAASDEIPSDASAGLASGVEKAPEKDSGIAEREDRSELGDVSKSWGSLNYKYESDTGTLILSGIYNGDRPLCTLGIVTESHLQRCR
ncbi:hypothetical protein [Gordonibacter sp. An230]|uniref:hypothetical protein n=1 Tax=Gordonibacter sp. An230 TaxID=1965592 RepID=UPI000B39F18C|nr:hypothetical protein [Gordonibacter sp. An230]